MFGRKANRIMELEAQVGVVRTLCESVVRGMPDKMPSGRSFEDGKDMGKRGLAMSIINGLNAVDVLNERSRR